MAPAVPPPQPRKGVMMAYSDLARLYAASRFLASVPRSRRVALLARPAWLSALPFASAAIFAPISCCAAFSRHPFSCVQLEQQLLFDVDAAMPPVVAVSAFCA